MYMKTHTTIIFHLFIVIADGGISMKGCFDYKYTYSGKLIVKKKWTNDPPPAKSHLCLSTLTPY